jgi:dihydrofolate reductase
MRITVHEFMTLDGVVQGPGAPEEDPTEGFTLGGWIVPLFDEEAGAFVAEWFTRTTALLLGRTTYGLFAPFWSQVTDPADPVAAVLNSAPKHVVSTTLTDPDWANTSVLPDLDAVRALKEQGEGELQVHGSCRLVRALHAAGLVDEFRIITFPVVLGQGRRLFPEGAAPTGFDVVESRMTAAGVGYRAMTPKPLSFGAYAVEEGKEVVR